MGEVVVTLKVFPEDPEKFNALKEEVSKIVKIEKSGEEEIGFGVKALIVTFIMGDEGGINEIEEKIASIEGVSNVQVTSVDRI